MSARVLPCPPTRHAAVARHRELEPLRYLAWLLGRPLVPVLERLPRSRAGWHALWCRLGDFMDLVYAAGAVVVCTVFGAVVAVGLLVFVPGPVLLGVAVVALVVWRLRVAGRRLAEMVDEALWDCEAPR